MFANMPDGPLVNRAGETKRRLYAVIAYEDDYVQPLILSAMRSLFPPDTWTLLPHAPSSSEPYSLGVLLHREQAPEGSKILQITQYERIDFEHAILHPRTSLINSYMIRKALIRKHFLSATVDNWVAKHPDSVLRTHVKRSEAFEVDFAEFLDDALVEAFDLRASLERNAALEASGGRTCDDGCLAVGTGQNQLDREPLSASDRPQVRISASLLSGASKAPGAHDGREWWILKPGMSDQGQGIRLFSTMDELQAIFDEWDAELTGSVDEDEGEEEGAQLSVPERGAAAETVQRLNEGHGDREDEHDGDEGKGHHCITASHLRHFVAQRYIHPPLLLPGLGFRKFHIRTYVLALGSLRVYVYRDMLALFAAKPYQPPSIPARRTTGDGDGDDEVAVGSTSTIDLEAHLTNTCLQTGRDGGSDNLADSVHRFWDLPFSSTGQAESIFEQITQVTGELFEAAARGMMVHFQPLESAFEVFGLDFLVDSTGTAWLLEANAFPDFKQTGQKLHGVVAQFWTEVLRLAVRPFLGDEWAGDGGEEGGTERGKVDGERTLGESGGMVLVKEVDLGRR